MTDYQPQDARVAFDDVIQYTSSYMDDCLSVCNLLKAAAACCERQLNDALSDLSISHCQATIMLKLLDGTVSMSALSKELCCHKSNITQIVGGLEKKLFIERSLLENDRRVSQLKLTTKGRNAALGLKNILCGSATDCMGIFSASEKATFASLLKKYIEKHRNQKAE